MTFQDRSTLLDKYGIKWTQDQEWRGEVGPNRKPHPIEVFQRVLLPLSPVEWLSCCMSDGSNYVGGCCGAMSALQDRLNHIFRFDSGWASGRELAEMAQIIIEHGDFEGFIPWDKTADNFIPVDKLRVNTQYLNPWDKISLCWHLIDGFYSAEVPHASHPDRTELQRSTYVLGNAMHYLSMCNLFENNPIKAPDSQERANRATLLARVLPALKLLNDNIDQLDLGPVKGWALIDTNQGPDEVATNGFGYCIYAERTEAETLYQTWVREAEEYEEIERKQHLADHLKIRPVQVTAQDGIQFTGPLESLSPDPPQDK